MAGGVLQAADDMVRIISNGLTFGLADKAAAALGEQDTAAKTAAARDRAGFAGDVASVGANLAGGKAAITGGLKLGKSVVVPAVKALASKKGALAALAGLGGLAEYNSRTAGAEAQPAPAAPKAVAVTKAAPAGKKADLDKVATNAAAQQGPLSFSDLVGHLADAQGGKISLRQLGALSEAAQRGANADFYAGGGSKKAAAPGDLAGRMLENQYIAQFQKALGDPNADPLKAQQEFENKVLQLRKTQFIDPYGLQDAGGE